MLWSFLQKTYIELIEQCNNKKKKKKKKKKKQ